MPAIRSTEELRLAQTSPTMPPMGRRVAVLIRLDGFTFDARAVIDAAKNVVPHAEE